MLKKIFPLSLCVSLLMTVLYFMMPAAVAAASVTSFNNIEMPCHEANQRVQACVVVHQFVAGNSAGLDHRTFSMTPAADLRGKAQTFSVIYIYHLNPKAYGGTATISVEHGDDGYMTDIKVGQPAMFWVTTHDGGRTFSKMTSNIPGGMSM
jgi:hypothetical protein